MDNIDLQAIEGFNLTKDEAYSIAELIELTLIDYIRKDDGFDSIVCLEDILLGYRKLCLISGYRGERARLNAMREENDGRK